MQVAQEQCSASVSAVKSGGVFDLLNDTPGVVRVEFDALAESKTERVEGLEYNGLCNASADDARS
jgi:hypothetical protein